MRIFIRIYEMVFGVQIGKRFSYRGLPIIAKKGTGRLIIGDDCRINSSLFSNLLGLYQRTIIIAHGRGSVLIGDHVGISGSSIIAEDRVTIGDHTLVGANCKIMDTDWHPVEPSLRLTNDQSAIRIKPVRIGRNVFIGCNSIILKGTVIGDNCVIGAGSVVTGEFGANLLIAGNPAKAIRSISEE